MGTIQPDEHPCVNNLMRDYLLRRLLLIPPTLLGIMVIVFIITRFVPGGPLERAIMEFQQLDISSGTATGTPGAARPSRTASSPTQRAGPEHDVPARRSPETRYWT